MLARLQKQSLVRNLSLVLMLTLSLVITSCGGSNKNVEIPGVDGPNLEIDDEYVVITFGLQELQIEGGVSYALPDYPNSYIEIGPDLQSAGAIVSFHMAITDVLDENNIGDPLRLPGGRPLPGVASGALPGFAYLVPELNESMIYVGKDVFGIFIPVQLGMQGSMATFRYYTGSKRVGNITLVGEDADGENDGLLLLLDMKGSVKKRLERQAKRFN